MKKINEKWLLIFVGFFLTNFSNAQKIESWSCHCQRFIANESFERVYNTDSTFIVNTKINSKVQISDTFLIKEDKIYFEKRDRLYIYFSEASFERGDTIKTFCPTPVDKESRVFPVDKIYIPQGKMDFHGENVLVYKVVDHFDSPKNSLNKIYFSPSKKRIIYRYSIEGGECYLN